MTGERITKAAYRAQQAFEKDRADFERLGGLFFDRTKSNGRRIALWQEWAREHPEYCKVVFTLKTVHIRKP